MTIHIHFSLYHENFGSKENGLVVVSLELNFDMLKNY